MDVMCVLLNWLAISTNRLQSDLHIGKIIPILCVKYFLQIQGKILLFLLSIYCFKFILFLNTVQCTHHRRRIELEDRAKVVVSDWGTESLPR